VTKLPLHPATSQPILKFHESKQSKSKELRNPSHHYEHAASLDPPPSPPPARPFSPLIASLVPRLDPSVGGHVITDPAARSPTPRALPDVHFIGRLVIDGEGDHVDGEVLGVEGSSKLPRARHPSVTGRPRRRPFRLRNCPLS
jgi:hypothetical protein